MSIRCKEESEFAPGWPICVGTRVDVTLVVEMMVGVAGDVGVPCDVGVGLDVKAADAAVSVKFATTV